MPTEFDTATAIHSVGAGMFTADLHDGWGVWDTVNGGYVAAIAARAMGDSSPHPHPVSLTTHFLRPGKPGPIRINVETVKVGSRFSRLRASVTQDEKALASLLGAFTDLSTTPDDLVVAGSPPPLPPRDECIEPQRSGFENASVAARLDVRAPERDVGFLQGSPSGDMTITAWIGLADGRAIDPLSLVFLVDAMPPPIFNAGIDIAWVPTIEITAHIRRFPAPGPLRMRLTSHHGTAGTIEEDTELWDSEDRLVAQSRQLALLP